MRKAIEHMLSAVLIAVALSACAASDEGGTSAHADPQGMWSGTTSDGLGVKLIVLDNGETWGLYMLGSSIYAGLHGIADSAGSKIVIKGDEHYFNTGISPPLNIIGNVQAKSSMLLQSQHLSSKLKYNASYDRPATHEAISGVWQFSGRSKFYDFTDIDVAIDNKGNFNIIQGGCLAIGKVTPRPGERNIYNATIKSIEGHCFADLTEMKGVASIDVQFGQKILLIFAKDASRKNSLVIAGIQP